MGRIEELETWGRDNGLELSAGDEFDWVPRIPFPVFQHGGGLPPLVWNVLTGTWRGSPIVWFDIGPGGEFLSLTHSFALVGLTAHVPPLHVGAQALLDRARDRLPLQGIQTEWDRFNEHFQINCEQRRFASELLDARMLQWIFGEYERLGPIGFDVADGWATAYTALLPPNNAGEVIDLALGFVARVPAIIYDLYPTG